MTIPLIPTKWGAYDTRSPRAPEGLLFIGDPHLSQRRPGRRLDADFAETVLDKLRQAIAEANRQNLVPVILGDLFQSPRDATPLLFSQIFMVLWASEHRPISNLGNHDKYETLLTPDCSLRSLAESRTLHVMHTADTCALTITLEDGPLALLGVPYGQAVPDAIVSPCPPERTVILTHEDFDFGGHYPGAKPLHAVQGASLLVNGHMHDTKPIEVRGDTVCFNPGNITRQTVDLRYHQPSVWSWRPGDRQPTQHVLNHVPGDAIFDLTGLQVTAAGQEAVAAEMAMPDSLFAQLLANTNILDQERTADGTFLLEEITAVLTEQGIASDHPIAQILQGLVDQALADPDDGPSPS